MAEEALGAATSRSLASVGGAGTGGAAAASSSSYGGEPRFMVTAALGTSRKPLSEAKSPGPIYMPRFGAVTRKDPDVVFDSAPRYPSSKHSDSGPGPGAYILPPEKVRASTLRGREKFGSAAATTQVDVPGPGEYPRVETTHTRARNPPAYSLKGRPITKPPSFAVPAPNAHQKYEPLNKFQHTDKLTNAPRVIFGRPPVKRELSKDAAAVFASPGPSEYAVDKGYAHVSTIKAAPAFSMVPRRPIGGERAGPKITPSFHKPAEGIGKQALSDKKTAPSVSFSGRVKFGSPY